MTKYVDLPNIQKLALNERLTNGNVERAKNCSYIMILIESLMIIRSYIFLGFSFNVYVCMYYSLIAVAVGNLLILHRLKDIKKLCERFKKQNIVLFAFYSFYLFWGVMVTLLDQSSYGHVTVFLTNLVTASTLFIMPMKKYFLLHIPPALVLFLGFLIVQENRDILFAHFINIVILYIFTILGARLIYNMFKKMVYQEVELSEKNKQLAMWSEKMALLATKDDLTKIHNRRGLYEIIVSNLQKGTANLSIVILDIDAFKHYNDYYGHIPGDEVLYTIAQAINDLVKEQGHEVARYGGEEFIVIAYSLTQEETLRLAESLRKAIEALQIPHEKSPIAAYVTASIGCAQRTISNMMEYEQLVMDADQALYEVKHSTRNAVKMFEHIMGNKV